MALVKKKTSSPFTGVCRWRWFAFLLHNARRNAFSQIVCVHHSQIEIKWMNPRRRTKFYLHSPLARRHKRLQIYRASLGSSKLSAVRAGWKSDGNLRLFKPLNVEPHRVFWHCWQQWQLLLQNNAKKTVKTNAFFSFIVRIVTSTMIFPLPRCQKQLTSRIYSMTYWRRSFWSKQIVLFGIKVKLN